MNARKYASAVRSAVERMQPWICASMSPGSGCLRPLSTLAETLQQREYWRKMYRGYEDVFTLDDVNENLMQFWPKLRKRIDAIPSNADTLPRILVPLCGRDISVAWIARQGLGAVGVDFVDEPLRALGNEVGGLVPLIDDLQQPDGRLSAYQAALLRPMILVHGDFFFLEEPDYGGRFEGVWDRAALTAVEPHRREEYVAKLYRLLHEGGAVLMEALACNLPLHGAMQAEEVTSLFEQGGFEVSVLTNKDVRGQYPSFDPPGLKYLREMVVLAVKKSPPVLEQAGQAQGSR